MRHKLSGRQFGRASGPRRAMFRIMVTDLLRHGQIKTTIAKAKEIRPMAEKMVTLGKNGSLHDRRQAAAFITDRSVVKTVFDAKSGELLGAHLIGTEVTELIQGFSIAKTLETTEAELMHTVFPHPTLSETMHEAVLDAYGRVIHF